MALADAYVQVYGQLPEFFKKISDGEAPPHFTTQHLKDLGFTSTNHRAIVPLLKALGFLDGAGVPTQRYHDYRNHSQSRAIMGHALKEAYSDLFVLKASPTQADKALIEGKFKSAHNTSPHVAKLLSNTFFALLALADIPSNESKKTATVESVPPPDSTENHDSTKVAHDVHRQGTHRPSLHYNIQIHLPATKDIEVFNAIFKSLKEHLLE